MDETAKCCTWGTADCAKEVGEGEEEGKGGAGAEEEEGAGGSDGAPGSSGNFLPPSPP